MALLAYYPSWVYCLVNQWPVLRSGWQPSLNARDLESTLTIEPAKLHVQPSIQPTTETELHLRISSGLVVFMFLMVRDSLSKLVGQNLSSAEERWGASELGDLQERGQAALPELCTFLSEDCSSATARHCCTP
eukprot:6407673-Amphidinium_carterae.1